MKNKRVKIIRSFFLHKLLLTIHFIYHAIIFLKYYNYTSFISCIFSLFICNVIVFLEFLFIDFYIYFIKFVNGYRAHLGNNSLSLSGWLRVTWQRYEKNCCAPGTKNWLVGSASWYRLPILSEGDLMCSF